MFIVRYVLFFLLFSMLFSCNREQARTSYSKLQEEYKTDSASLERRRENEKKNVKQNKGEYSIKSGRNQGAKSDSMGQAHSSSTEVPAIALAGKYEGIVKGQDNKSYGYVLLSVNDQFTQEEKLNGVLYIPGGRINVSLDYETRTGEVYINQLGRGKVMVKNQKIAIQSTADNAFNWELQSFKTYK
ncbi:MAG: hypothetical protein ACOCWW_00460 [Bacteroidota bacterium]